jgi:hypothetical protein
MYYFSEESDAANEALPPQLNRNWDMHNEIRGRLLGRHVLAKTMNEFHACKARKGQHLIIGAQDSDV